jgi:hypothetical protein
MSVYIPNEAEKEALKAILLQQAMVLFLCKNQIQPDGNTVFATLEEMPTGGGRGYAPFVLTNNVKEGVVVADKWAMMVNASGKAEATYSNATKVWTFLAPDVADVNTVFGVGGYFLILPFTTGAKEIKVGETIKQGSATAIVTGVDLTSGSWAAGTAAGNLYLKMQTGTFAAGDICIQGEILALTETPTDPGSGYDVGELFSIGGDGEGGVGVVLTVDAGAVLTVGTVPAAGGRNYAVGTGKATAKLTGGGDDALTVAVATLKTAAYAAIAGDSSKKLMFVEALTTPIPITALGQTVSYTPKFTMSTG